MTRCQGRVWKLGVMARCGVYGALTQWHDRWLCSDHYRAAQVQDRVLREWRMV